MLCCGLVFVTSGQAGHLIPWIWTPGSSYSLLTISRSRSIQKRLGVKFVSLLHLPSRGVHMGLPSLTALSVTHLTATHSQSAAQSEGYRFAYVLQRPL